MVDLGALDDLILPAVAVAALAALESLLSATVADGMSVGQRHDPDRELLGQGIANLAAPLFGGIPATAAIARTAVNVRSGAASRLASVATACGRPAHRRARGGPVGRHDPGRGAGRRAHRHRRADGPLLEPRCPDALHPRRRNGVGRDRTGHGAHRPRHGRARRPGRRWLLRAATGVPRRSHRPGAAGRERPQRRGASAARRAHRRLPDGRPAVLRAAHDFLLELANVSDVRVVVLRMARVTVIDATGATVLADTISRLEGQGITVMLSGVSRSTKRCFASSVSTRSSPMSGTSSRRRRTRSRTLGCTRPESRTNRPQPRTPDLNDRVRPLGPTAVHSIVGSGVSASGLWERAQRHTAQ